MSKHRRKRRRRSSRSKDKIQSSGNGRYAKLSEKVFLKTGMPLSRLLFLGFGLVLISGLIFYALRDPETSAQTPEDILHADNAIRKSDEENFITAASVPPNFTSLPLPIRIDTLEDMISKCKFLLNKETKYKLQAQEKLISLLALRSVTLSQAGVDPAPSLNELARMTAVFSDENSEDDSSLTLAYANLTALSFKFSPETYDATIKAINRITETTPGTKLKISGCRSQAIRLIRANPNDEKIIELINLFGSKLAANKAPYISDAGLALLDYPNFSQFYNRPIEISQFDSDKDLLMLEQAVATPPQSSYTLNILLLMPDQFLENGKVEEAKKVYAQIKEIVSRCPENVRNSAELQMQKIAKRVALFDQPFLITGTDASGDALKSNPNKQSIIFFFSPSHAPSREALMSLTESAIHDPWKVDFFILPVRIMSEKEVAAWQRSFPDSTFLDLVTSKAWVAKTGAIEVPYQIILDKDDKVLRVGRP